MIRTSLTQWTQSAGRDVKEVIELSFPVDLTMTLSGATRDQLARWRKPPALLAPEVSALPVRYSFRDILALRTMVYLRRDISLQRIRVAFESLNRMDLTEHPSRYQLAISGNTIVLVEEDGATDLVEKPGQRVLANLADVFRPFPNFKDQEVVDFLHPRPLLEIREARMGGWPTIRGTRVPYDTIARLQQGDGGVPSEMVSNFYPSVNRRAALDALDFEEQVKAG